jgi:hypothetical protein
MKKKKKCEKLPKIPIGAKENHEKTKPDADDTRREFLALQHAKPLLNSYLANRSPRQISCMMS